MNRQKNTTLIPSIIITAIVIFIGFFNMYLSMNQTKLLPNVPSNDVFQSFQTMATIATSTVVCFAICILAISMRFQQKVLVSLFFLIQGGLFYGVVYDSLTKYYEGAPTNIILQLFILAMISFVLFCFYDVEKIFYIGGGVAYGIVIITSIIFTILGDKVAVSTSIYWALIVDTFQCLAMIGLIVIAALKLKNKEAYAQPILIALIVFASFMIPNFVLSSFVPTYFSFYQVSFLISYCIIGFCILNDIITLYDQENRAIALEQEIDKQFIQRRNYYNNYAEQLDCLQNTEDTTYCSILAVESLILQYAKHCKIKKIEFNAKLDIPADIRVKHGDLCLSLSNLLDNALEACDNMPTGRKFIDVEASKVDHMLMLEIKNSYNALPLEPSGALFLTTKEFIPKGMGLTSTKDIATRYNGSLSVRTAVDVPEPQFVTQVFLAHVL